MDFLPVVSSGSLEDAIVKTVAFFDVFDYPLTVDEVSERLLGFEASREDIQHTVQKSERILFIDGYVVFPQRERIVALRLQNVSQDLALWKRVKKYEWIFRCVPFLHGVYVCNRLAISQGIEESDIDLFVVADTGRMFFVRTMLLVIFQIFGARRHGDKIPGRFCLSFFVDMSAADLSPLLLGSDIYFAYWFLLLKPLYGIFDIAKMNTWIEEYFSKNILPSSSDVNFSRPNFFGDFLQWIFGGKFGNFIERRLMSWQLARAVKKSEALGKPDGLVLTEHCLKFHDHDMRSQYFREWKRRIEKY